MKSSDITGGDDSQSGISDRGGTGAGDAAGAGVDVAGAESPPLFREVQRMRQWVFWLPIAMVAGVIWWTFAQQVVLGHPQGAKPIPNLLAWVLTFVGGVGLPAFGWAMRVITEVRPGMVWVRMSPFRGIHIPAEQIRSAFAREYSPLREYGGWGVRMKRQSGRAYNAHGNQGVQLVLVNGQRIMIGSQRSEELESALRLAGFAPEVDPTKARRAKRARKQAGTDARPSRP